MNPVNKRAEVERWGVQSGVGAGAGAAGAAEARAAACVEAARPATPLTPEAMSRIANAVQRRRYESPARGGRGLSLRWQLAIFALVSLASVATARGMMTLWRRYTAAPSVEGTEQRARVRGRRAPVGPEAAAVGEAFEKTEDLAARELPGSRELPVAPELPVSRELPSSVALPAAPAAPLLNRHAASSASRRAHVHRSHAPVHHAPSAGSPAPSAALPATSSRPGTEAQLLARALGRLRQDHDPVGALALLDTYADSFPSGVLAAEAQAARIEATLQSGDRQGALALLDGHASFHGRWGMQWLLTRAELRTSTGRYTEALVDFDHVLASESNLPPSEGERALYGRAVCLGRLGRADQARADLNAYRGRFPHGKHSAEVSRLLAGAGSDEAP